MDPMPTCEVGILGNTAEAMMLAVILAREDFRANPKSPSLVEMVTNDSYYKEIFLTKVKHYWRKVAGFHAGEVNRFPYRDDFVRLAWMIAEQDQGGEFLKWAKAAHPSLFS